MKGFDARFWSALEPPFAHVILLSVRSRMKIAKCSFWIYSGIMRKERSIAVGFLKKIQYNSPVVLTFALLSAVALLLNWITGGAANRLLFSVYPCSWADPLGYIRLFGHVLGHAGFDHYAGNMILFLLLGPILEEKYGSRNLLLMIAVVALITGLADVLFMRVILLGASGVVFMAIILASMVSGDKGRIPLTFLIVVCVYLGKEIADGILAQDGISHLTHIISGLCGGGFGLFFNRCCRLAGSHTGGKLHF